ncbi:hypothetical protein HDV05_000393, partial [Chytridiales sp. JEL 0842]
MHPNYHSANLEWDTLALHHPLIHKQTGTKIHLCGVHHKSLASYERVKRVVEELKPIVVTLETDRLNLERFAGKFEVLGGRLLPMLGLEEQHPNMNNSDHVQDDHHRPTTTLNDNQWHLTPSELSRLELFGFHPSSNKPTDLLHGLEIHAALQSSLSTGSYLKCIDLPLPQIRNPPTHHVSAFLEQVRNRYKLPFPPDKSDGTRTPGTLMHKMESELDSRRSLSAFG